MAVTVDPGMVALGRGGLLKNCTMSADFLRKLRDRRKLDFVSSGAAEPRRRNFYSAKVGHELNNGPDGEFHKTTPQPQANGETAYSLLLKARFLKSLKQPPPGQIVCNGQGTPL